ncbi:MAG: hypothetical protein H0V11_00960 [Actinobacteria bacterium]|nr:hypothetical protein [Actinomycetota bacterium]
MIPILDSVLETYLRRVDGLRRTSDAPRDAVELIRSYKRELDAVLPALQALREELHRRGIELTECRLLDLFLWGYSGTYTPLYLRTETAASTGEAGSRASPAPAAVPLAAEGVNARAERSAMSGAVVLEDMTTAELLALSRASLRELKRRGVVRSGNAPAGDYAELLVQRATGGEHATPSRTTARIHSKANQ